jgi:beta-alanine--pyruvate transaminase
MVSALKIATAFSPNAGNPSRFRMIGPEHTTMVLAWVEFLLVVFPQIEKPLLAWMMPGVDHLPHTYNLSQMAFSRGQPTWGAHSADELRKTGSSA